MPPRGLNRSRGKGAPPRCWGVTGSEDLFRLWDEASRLGSRLEQNHELIASSDQPVTPGHARRHAHAQARGQDAEPLHSRRTYLLLLAATLPEYKTGAEDAGDENYNSVFSSLANSEVRQETRRRVSVN